jgi:hypothetical protein
MKPSTKFLDGPGLVGLVRGLFLQLGCVLLIALGGCKPAAPTAAVDVGTSTPPLGPPLFDDVTKAVGVDMTYRNGEEAGHLAIPESLGGGVALLDFDGDGLLDIFIPGGGYYEGLTLKGYPSKLYRNLGGFRFEDVTAAVGLGSPNIYSHGGAVGDYDNDGWPDLLVTGYGRPLLFHNVSDGKGGRKFEEVGVKAGINENLWASSAAWGDLDGDGYPDLYICQYGDWSFEHNHPTDCTYDGKTRDVCPPRYFKPLPHKLYRNNRDGTFTDDSAALAAPRNGWPDSKKWTGGKGLGVVLVDLDGDGRPDIFVTCDTDDKLLYFNRTKRPGEFKLEEKALVTGAARNERGIANGSMGVDAADFDGSGRPALWCTNYEKELHGLYKNECRQGREFFVFATQAAGIGAIGQNFVGWGTGFVDFDHHGWEDLFIVNGHAIRYPAGLAGRRERPVYMANKAGKFVEASRRCGDYFQTEHNARGVAFGDLDNDGKVDVVISHLNEPVVVLRNVAANDNHWLGLELVGKDKRDVVGARITVKAGGRWQTRYAKGGASFASSSDRRHVIGLADATEVESVQVQWPSGKTQAFEVPKVDCYWRLTEGEKEPTPPVRRPR